MSNFWSYYQNIKRLDHSFTVFGISHILHLLVCGILIVLCFRQFKKCGKTGKRRWLHGMSIFFVTQELFFYIWTYIGCRKADIAPLFQVLQLELCTFCLFADFSTLFLKNKQIRFFGALIGFVGGPIALIYPATIADIYPLVGYRMFQFFSTHAGYLLFTLMLLEDKELLTRKRLYINWGVLAAMLTAIYFFNIRFGTQYMFVGTPPEIPFIRMVYDFVGTTFFLPAAILALSAYQTLIYWLLTKLRKVIYKEEALHPALEESKAAA